jgi:hypothetical protein
MAADWNVQRPAPTSERVSHRTCKNGHLSELAKKREAVPGSRIRNQVPQFAQLKRRPQSQSQSFQVETGERIAGGHGDSSSDTQRSVTLLLLLGGSPFSTSGCDYGHS